jgi:signal transduction histidine kinase
MYQWIEKIFNIGIDNSTKTREVSKIKILNQIIFGSIVIILIIMVQDSILLDSFQILIDFLMFSACFLSFVLHYYKKFQWARYYFVFGLSIVATYGIICFGEQIRGEYIYFIFVIIAVVVFDSIKMIYGTCIYIFTLFLIQKIYLYNFPPLFVIHTTLADKLVPFLGYLNASVFVLYTFKRQHLEAEDALIELLHTNEQSNIQLKSVNGELERFAHSASHDLKSPLRTIVSFLNIIERKINKKEYNDLDEYIQFAKKGGEQMNSLVNDILQFSTVGADQKIPTEEVDLNEVFSTVDHQLMSVIEEKNAILTSEKLPTLDVNKMLITILFQNLIENGLKYNKSEQPKVEIKYQIVDNRHQISFIDNGIGISKEYHEKIFDLFYRLHSVESYQGTGMGLAICKKIVTQMNGEMHIQSEIGVGSTFILSFENK